MTEAMYRRPWAKPAIGVLLIGGILAGLWAAFGTRSVEPTDTDRPAAVRLADAEATLRVHDGSGTRRSRISCDGDSTRASGFWAADPAQACAALASTRAALLSGPGCGRIGRGRVGIEATGSFGARRFVHRAVRGGCPDEEGWLDVNVLASPVLEPEQELEPSG